VHNRDHDHVTERDRKSSTSGNPHSQRSARRNETAVTRTAKTCAGIHAHPSSGGFHARRKVEHGARRLNHAIFGNPIEWIGKWRSKINKRLKWLRQ